MVGDARCLKKISLFYMVKFRCLAPVHRNISLYAWKNKRKHSNILLLPCTYINMEEEVVHRTFKLLIFKLEKDDWSKCGVERC